MRGGKRTGAGRKPGSQAKRTVERAQQIEQVARALDEALPNAFRGDAHALLMAVYKDETHPLPLRLDAAKAAISFERPRLAAIDHSGEMTQNIVTDQPEKTRDEWTNAYADEPTAH